MQAGIAVAQSGPAGQSVGMHWYADPHEWLDQNAYCGVHPRSAGLCPNCVAVGVAHIAAEDLTGVPTTLPGGKPPPLTAAHHLYARDHGFKFKYSQLPHCDKCASHSKACLDCQKAVKDANDVREALLAARRQTLVPEDDADEGGSLPERMPDDQSELERIRTRIKDIIDKLIKECDIGHDNGIDKRFLSMLHERIGVFCDEFRAGGAAKLPPELHMEIELDPAVKPRRASLFRQGAYLQAEWDKTINNYRRINIIAELHAKAPWMHQAFFTKQHGAYRFVVNYKPGINKATIPSPATLPNFNGLVNYMQGAQFFTKLDLKSAYYQIPLKESSRHLTAFQSPDGKAWCFNVIPLGVRNAPPHFQRIMRYVLGDALHKYCLVALDDIIIYSKTAEEHLAHVNEVLARLEKHALMASISKTSFAVRRVKFLGHWVTAARDSDSPVTVQIDDRAAAKLLDMPQPLSLPALRSFLCLANYFSPHIHNLADITAPLRQMEREANERTRAIDPKKNRHGLVLAQRLQWTPERVVAFQKVKELLARNPVLRTPDYSRPFYLITDASAVAIGAILLQRDPATNQLYAVRYGSKLLSSTQRNYSASERECLAVVHFLKAFREFYGDQKVTLYTDHSALVPIIKASDSSNLRLRRWAVQISDVDLEVFHIKGTENAADALSRLVALGEDLDLYASQRLSGSKDPTLAAPAVLIPEYTVAQLRDEQLKDEELSLAVGYLEDSFDNLSKHEVQRLSLMTRNMAMVDGVLHFRATRERLRHLETTLLLVVPKQLREYVLQIAHGGPTHFGRRRTDRIVLQRYWWPTVHVDVADYVKRCEQCQATQPANSEPPGRLGRYQPVSAPLQRVAMDFIGPVDTVSRTGKQYILTIVDHFTRFAYAVAVKRADSECAARAFVKFCYLYSCPSEIITDQGSHFTSEFIKRVMELLAVRHKFTMVRNPQANGMDERFNGTIQNLLRRAVTGEPLESWSDLVLPCVFAYNTTPHEVTGETPFFLMNGFDPRTPLDGILDTPEHRIRDAYSVDDYRYLLLQQRELIKDVITDATRQAQEQAAARDEERRSDYVFEPGGLVMREVEPATDEIRKFGRRWAGPYRVVDNLNNTTIVIKNIYNSKEEPKLVSPRLLKPFHTPYSDTPDALEAGHYVVERIIDEKTEKRAGKPVKFFRVRWAGFTRRSDSWLPDKEVPDSIKDVWEKAKARLPKNEAAPAISVIPPDAPSPQPPLVTAPTHPTGTNSRSSAPEAPPASESATIPAGNAPQQSPQQVEPAAAQQRAAVSEPVEPPVRQDPATSDSTQPQAIDSRKRHRNRITKPQAARADTVRSAKLLEPPASTSTSSAHTTTPSTVTGPNATRVQPQRTRRPAAQPDFLYAALSEDVVQFQSGGYDAA